MAPNDSTIPASDTCSKLLHHINADIKVCQSLLILLKNERAYLKQRAFEQLDHIIDEKASALTHLEKSANLRSQMVQQYIQANQCNDEFAWKNILEEFESPALLKQWQALKHLIDECKVENEVNGKLMSRSEHTVTRLLNIMRGQDGDAQLYNMHGSTSADDKKHQIGEA